MGQCRTLDADVTIGCYYSDYSSCHNTIPTSLFVWNKFFSLTLVKFKVQVAIVCYGGGHIFSNLVGSKKKQQQQTIPNVLAYFGLKWC